MESDVQGNKSNIYLMRLIIENSANQIKDFAQIMDFPLIHKMGINRNALTDFDGMKNRTNGNFNAYEFQENFKKMMFDAWYQNIMKKSYFTEKENEAIMHYKNGDYEKSNEVLEHQLIHYGHAGTYYVFNSIFDEPSKKYTHRLYVNMDSEHSCALIYQIYIEALKSGKHLNFNHKIYGSFDNIVIYSDQESLQYLIEIIGNLEKTQPELFQNQTKPLALPVAKGVNLTAEPNVDSFTENRTKMLREYFWETLSNFLLVGEELLSRMDPQTYNNIRSKFQNLIPQLISEYNNQDTKVRLNEFYEVFVYHARINENDTYIDSAELFDEYIKSIINQDRKASIFRIFKNKYTQINGQNIPTTIDSSYNGILAIDYEFLKSIPTENGNLYTEFVNYLKDINNLQQIAQKYGVDIRCLALNASEVENVFLNANSIEQDCGKTF